jgi:glutamate synthase (NADPH/NADH) large chain
MPDAYHEVLEQGAEDVRDSPPTPAESIDAVTTHGASAD